MPRKQGVKKTLRGIVLGYTHHECGDSITPMTSEPVPTPEVTENLTGKRVVAGAIDVIVLAVLFFVMSAMFGDTESEGSSFSVNLSGGPALIYFLLVLAYYLVPEGISGQTLGKRIMGLRVVALDASLSWGKVAIRNILRIVDGLPIFYLVGIIAIAVSKKHQRIGDMAAQTIVVSV